jgi:anaerobic carbon-monoxide dehydrogenase iron sulfur subunit
MEKILITDPEKCTGCRLCEQVCSVKHTGKVNPYRARIKIFSWELEGKVLPMVCQQCDDPPCMKACPVEAISKDIETGLVFVNEAKCIGCRMCTFACPFGTMTYDWVDNKVIKCDFCGGDPQCVRFCDAKAIRFEEKSKSGSIKRKAAAEKIKFALSAE